KGFVTVYDFVFTNCAGTCPMMTATLRRITQKVDKNAKVRFVSISVDPARDTPAVLHAYADKVRNDDRWMFLTGDPKTIVDPSINALSGILLFTAYILIRKKRVQQHRRFMLAACFTSITFLACYVLNHYLRHGVVTKFTATGWVRPVYFSILISHTILAVTIVP